MSTNVYVFVTYLYTLILTDKASSYDACFQSQIHNFSEYGKNE